MLSQLLDDSFETARERTTWMPAHGPLSKVSSSLTSTGAAVTPIMWRANRLVDALAKLAAQPARLPTACSKFVASAAKLVESSLLTLGAVTLAANHHKSESLDGQGILSTTFLRDSTADRPNRPKTPAKKKKKKRASSLPAAPPTTKLYRPLTLPSEEAQVQTASLRRSQPCRDAPQPTPHQRWQASRASSSKALGRDRAELGDEANVARWLGKLSLRKRETSRDAPSRMAQLEARVKQRLRCTTPDSTNYEMLSQSGSL